MFHPQDPLAEITIIGDVGTRGADLTGEVRDKPAAGGLSQSSPGFLHFAGFRYWTASLLPALMGTTLPFWLRPPGFSFRWLGALEFLIATLLFHAGFSCRLGSTTGRTPTGPGLDSSGLRACASSQLASWVCT